MNAIDTKTVHSIVFSHLRDNLGSKLTPALVTGLTATITQGIAAATEKGERPQSHVDETPAPDTEAVKEAVEGIASSGGPIGPLS